MQHLTKHPARVRRSLAYGLIAGVGLVTLVVDLYTKWLAEAHLPRNTIRVIPGFFDLRLMYNTGVAFGMFRDLPDSLRVPLLVFASAGILTGVVIYCMPLLVRSPVAATCAGALVGGAMGNLYERFRFGKVVDFLYFHIGGYSWPAFNVADMGIVVGLAIMLVVMMRFDAEVARIERHEALEAAAHDARPVTREKPRGFTLLEVMISLAILSISLVTLIEAQGQSIYATSRIREFSVIPFLAESKMNDLERLVWEKGFGTFSKSEDGTFEEEGYPEIRWVAEFKKTDIRPQLDLLGGMGGEGGAGGAAGGDGSSLGNPAGGAGGVVPGSSLFGPSAGASGMISGFIDNFVRQLNERIRYVKLSIIWNEGKRERQLDIVTHLVDLPRQQQSGGVATGAGAAAGAAAGAQGLLPAGTTTGGLSGTPTIPGFGGTR